MVHADAEYTDGRIIYGMVLSPDDREVIWCTSAIGDRSKSDSPDEVHRKEAKPQRGEQHLRYGGDPSHARWYLSRELRPQDTANVFLARTPPLSLHPFYTSAPCSTTPHPS